MATAEIHPEQIIANTPTANESRAGAPLRRPLLEVAAAWRAVLEEVRVQAGLAGMGIRDDVTASRRLGENVWLAARVYLNDALYDATHGTAVYRPVRCVVRDLRRATRAVAGVAHRA